MPKNINAQQWLNEKYPFNDKCQRSADSDNKGKERKYITDLDIQIAKVDRGKKKLYGELKLAGFTNLKYLDIACHNLNSLDISNCLNLERLDISGNKSIQSLNLSNNSKLLEVEIKGCDSLKPENILTHLKFDQSSFKLVKRSSITSPVREQIRNILIIGMTGSGKSSLANTLTNTCEFKSGNQSVGLTKIFQKSESFSWNFNDLEYRFKVIDNIGFGDPKGTDFTEQILYRIGEGIKEIEGEINQILFLVRGRFDSFQIEMFNLFKNFINENEITKFTTLVITGFENFGDTKKKEVDKIALLTESSKIRDLIESCNDILYINNPGIDKSGNNDNEILQMDREESKMIILNHLAEKCNQIYKLKEWENIKKKVDDCLLKIQEINNQISQTDNQKKINDLAQEKKSTFIDFVKGLGKIRAEKINVKGNMGVNIAGVSASIEVAAENLHRIQ